MKRKTIKCWPTTSFSSNRRTIYFRTNLISSRNRSKQLLHISKRLWRFLKPVSIWPLLIFQQQSRSTWASMCKRMQRSF